MGFIGKIRSFSWLERWLLVKAALIVVVVRMGLRVVPYKKVQQFSDRVSASSSLWRARRDDLTYQNQVVRAVRAVARHTLGGKPCLVQAIAAQWMLRHTAHPSSLHLGVAKGKGESLKAHAWLERRGDIIIGGRSSPYLYAPVQRIRREDA